MAVTLASFRARFPEFVKASDTMVQECIDDAASQVDLTVWGTDKGMRGIRYLAAHLVATNPRGEMAKLEGKQETDYWKQYNSLKRQVAAGFRVI